LKYNLGSQKASTHLIVRRRSGGRGRLALSSHALSQPATMRLDIA
jgi:hypothetical protein